MELARGCFAYFATADLTGGVVVVGTVVRVGTKAVQLQVDRSDLVASYAEKGSALIWVPKGDIQLVTAPLIV